ncbi:unnamed protein product [Brassica oleracea]
MVQLLGDPLFNFINNLAHLTVLLYNVNTATTSVRIADVCNM